MVESQSPLGSNPRMRTTIDETINETTMIAAISHLEVYLHTLETNEPIHRAEGNSEQADLELVSVEEVRQALSLLYAMSAPLPAE